MRFRACLCLFVVLILWITVAGLPRSSAQDGSSGGSQSKHGQAPADPVSEGAGPLIGFSGDAAGSMKQEAARVKKNLGHQARSIFIHTPLGWNLDTLDYLSRQVLRLPAKLPALVAHILEQGRILGFAGSMILLVFLAAVGYSLIGRKRVLQAVENAANPVSRQLPEEFYPYFLLILRSLAAALIPLILLAVFGLIKGFIVYKAAWFLLIGRLLLLWSVGALFLSLMRGLVELSIIPAGTERGERLANRTRRLALYILIGAAVLWSAEAVIERPDVVALLRFVVYLSIVCLLFLFFLRKRSILSFLPQLPYKSYQSFLRGLNRYYYPVISLTFLTGVLWCLGFKRFSSFLWTKTWAVAGIFIISSVIYHVTIRQIQRLADRAAPDNEEARHFFKSLKVLVLYVSVIVTAVIMLDLLGLLSPIQRFMSFQLIKVGNAPLSLWVLVKAGLILLVFVYLSRLLCAYLDYRVYPRLVVEPGLAYAINTFLKYFFMVVGALASLQIVGFDLRALMVFAGAVGIGVGLAMQTVMGNMIAGFAIIFGGKIRKGDWIEIHGTLGVVTDIYLRATKVRNRDNIEYLIPNADLMSTTIINYSLSSPMIRIAVPFGVSYAADPDEVGRIAVAVAEKEPRVMGYRNPEIRFMGYGDSSIDFELLIWIDVRKTARRLIRSRLYFALFDALKAAGIEIPFPQRDLHIRSGAVRHARAQEEEGARLGP